MRKDASTWDNWGFMSLLSPTDQKTLRDMFADMTQQVTILFFTQTIGCDTCDETKTILAELTALTDQIVVEEVNLVLDGGRAAVYGIDRAPGLVLLAGGAGHARAVAGRAGRLRLHGRGRCDSGRVGRHRCAAQRRKPASCWRRRTRRRRTSRCSSRPTCVYCPRAVGLAVRMAFANPHITATTVCATEFYDLARQYRVTGVPKTVVNGEIEILGRAAGSAVRAGRAGN